VVGKAPNPAYQVKERTMKSATALTTLAVGAVFAFAVTAHPSFVNIQILGWVLMLTGIAGLVIPRRGRGWLRRSVLVKGSPDITENAAADSGKPVTSLTSAETAPTIAEGQVERESIVEYTEK
jgi:hypothetical protein